MTTTSLRDPQSVELSGGTAWLSHVTALATLIMLVVNSLATIRPLNQQTTAALSDRYPVLITPAGYVFAIWGLIYVGAIVWTIYQWLPAQRRNSQFHRLRWLWIASCLLNSAWLFAWHWHYLSLSLIIMVCLLTSLIWLYYLIPDRPTWRIDDHSLRYWALTVPISIYLGWISVATIVNVAVVLFDVGWSGWGVTDVVWTAVMILAAGVLASLMLLREHNPWFASVIIWATIGIALKHGDTPAVASTAWITAIIIGLTVIALEIRQLLKPTPIE